MSEIPREAVEFARMVVRAFYPSEFIILMDAVLRHNNYCAHHQLAQRLGLQPKELRQVLNRMVQARLMRSDKRTQKKVNIHDDRRPARTLTTEFWYVPLGSVVDTFLYRVHKITKGIDERQQNEVQRQKQECTMCGTIYDLLDILSFQTTERGFYICEKMGVRPDRRPWPCGGVIREQDNSAKVKELERTKQMVIEELRELRERAAALARLEIPNHPLANADDKTWNEIVPETIGMRGEKVDEDGAPIVEKDDDGRANAAEAASAKNTATATVGDNAIPDRPSWFESAVEEGDDEWDFEQDNLVNTKKGTAASFNEDEEKAYFQRYLQDIGGRKEPSTSAQAAATTDRKNNATPNVNVKNNKPGVAELDKPQDVGMDDEADDVMVSVAGEQVKLSQVTEDMKEKMTGEEYKAYFELERQNGHGGGGDSDDDEFE